MLLEDTNPYWEQSQKVNVHFVSQCNGILTNLCIPSAICTYLRPCVPQNSMICGVVLVKCVEIVFTLKQFCFSFLDETAVRETAVICVQKI